MVRRAHGVTTSVCRPVGANSSTWKELGPISIKIHPKSPLGMESYPAVGAQQWDVKRKGLMF